MLGSEVRTTDGSKPDKRVRHTEQKDQSRKHKHMIKSKMKETR